MLGFPTDSTPYLLALSYGFDGESRLYFVSITGTDSTKASLSNRANTASFLVYSAETMFHWQSVLTNGTIQPLSVTDYADLTADQTPTWRPELFETASTDEMAAIDTLGIDDWSVSATQARYRRTPNARVATSPRDLASVASFETANRL